MKSLVCTTPGHFEYKESEDIKWQPGFTLLKIKRVGVCGTDLHAFEGTQPYFNYPRILGHEIAAEIVKTDAEGFEEKENVTFIPYFNCNACVACRKGKPNCCVNIKVCGVHVDGAMAEYFLIPSSFLLHGKNLNFDQLAVVEPLAIGAHAVRRAGLEKNDIVLIIGAGPIGLAAMELARIAGAHVVAMDVNENRLSFCKKMLKIEHIINAATDDVMARLQEITNADMPAVVFDATGNLKAINNAFQYISHGGKYVLIGLQKEAITFSHPEFHKREATLMSSRNATRDDFMHVMDSIEKKLIDPESYITHRMKFAQVKDGFSDLLDANNGVVKAMIEM